MSIAPGVRAAEHFALVCAPGGDATLVAGRVGSATAAPSGVGVLRHARAPAPGNARNGKRRARQAHQHPRSEYKDECHA